MEKLFSTSEIKIGEGYLFIPELRQLLEDYEETINVSACFQGFKAEIENLPGDYASPKGGLFVAFAQDVLAGCIAIKPVDAISCELKRLYVKPAFRRLGLGEALLDKAISAARSIGYDKILLNTMPSMKNAISLYETYGFVEIENYCTVPICGSKCYCFNLKG